MKHLNMLASLVLSGAILAGCSSSPGEMPDVVKAGEVSVREQAHPSITVVSVSPDWLYADLQQHTVNDVRLGARWSSTKPELVALDLAYESRSTEFSVVYMEIQGLELSIDGADHHYKAGTQTVFDNSRYNLNSRLFHTKSLNSIVVPVDVLEQLETAQSCQITIFTSLGNESADLCPGQGREESKPSAVNSLRSFIQQVQEKRQQGIIALTHSK